MIILQVGSGVPRAINKRERERFKNHAVAEREMLRLLLFPTKAISFGKPMCVYTKVQEVKEKIKRQVFLSRMR